jgi:hypothetical protein
MRADRAFRILFLLVFAGTVAACDRPTVPLHECSNGNYRAAPNGEGVCRCVNYQWDCNEGSGAAVSGATDGSAEATPVPGQSP